MAEGEKIIPISIEDEMKSAYIDYSMSVIVSRALPDVRDGLKPVHRRVLYGMLELGVLSNRAYKKSARIVGEVLGKYHPHGDSSVYDTMVRLAQDWSMRYPMVDGQETSAPLTETTLQPCVTRRPVSGKWPKRCWPTWTRRRSTWPTTSTTASKSPTVLPAKIPNLLVNGAAGIAVGMATNMPPHNLTEVIDGCVAMIDDPNISVEGLMEYIKAPDFPTGGVIYGVEGVKDAYETGRGRVVMRGKARFEETRTGKEQIIVEEIPYQVNKADMVRKAADLVNEKKIDGISEIRDESDRKGMRVVFDLKRDAIPNVVLNKLYKYTQLQTSFSVNNIALVKGGRSC